jgi:hypothetical protein
MKNNSKNYVIAISLVLLTFVMRLVPHLANFTPLFTIGIFSAVFFKNRLYSILLPIIAMLISDIFLGFYTEVWAIYLSMLVAQWISFDLAKSDKKSLFATANFVAPTIFFILSNFAVWITWYSHDFIGLSECYINALPFYGITVVSTFLYSYLFYGIYKINFKHSLKIQEN